MNISKIIAIVVCLPICYFLASDTLYAQIEIRHITPQFLEREKPAGLVFELSAVDESEVLEALIFYRTNGEGSFIQQEVEFRNGSSEFEIEITDPQVSLFEYYYMVRMVSGRQYTYPNVTEDQPPILLEVIEPRVPAYEKTDVADVAILSPSAGSTLSQDDLFISVALFYDETELQNRLFKLHVNGEDVSNRAEITPYMIKYYPENMSRGKQTVQVLIEDSGSIFEVEQWTFNVAGNAVLGRDIRFAESRREFNGNVELGGRSQYISGRSTDALQGRLQLRGREGDFYYSVRSYLTSQESDRYQPQNRYMLNVRFRNNFYLNAGDTTPQLSSYSINGRRVRGLHTGVNFWDDKLQFEVIYGSLSRSVRNLYRSIDVREAETINATEELFLLELDDGGSGSFRRNIAGGRLSIGNAEKFRFSLNAVRVRDDTTSITQIRDFNDLLSLDPSLTSSLTQQQNEFLSQNPNQLQVSPAVPKPQENLVLSTEFEISADEQRIRLHTELGASLLNRDISRGVLDRETADRLGIDMSENLENLFSNLAWLIIINDQMSTLPFRYSDTEGENSRVNLFFPSSIIANETRVDLNYFNQRVQVQYRWVGPDFNSLANNTIRRDIAGFNITDRFRFAQNRFFVTLGAERYRDNVNNYKTDTTINKGVRGNISWYPFKYNLPRISAGVRYRTRNNSVQRFNPFVPEENEGAAVRNFEISDGDTLITSTPRNDQIYSYNASITQSFNLFDANHEAGVSFNRTKTESSVFDYGDSENRNIAISLMSQFNNKPFRTRLSYNNTSSVTLSGLNDIGIHSINAGIDWALPDRNLILNGMLSFARSNFESLNLIIDEGELIDRSRDNFFTPSFSEAERRSANSYILRMGAEYSVFRNSTLSLLVNYSFVEARSNLFANIPNDRIIQLNYTYRF